MAVLRQQLAVRNLTCSASSARVPKAIDELRIATITDHFFAEQDGHVEARIAICVKNLSSPWRYLDSEQSSVPSRRFAFCDLDAPIRRATTLNPLPTADFDPKFLAQRRDDIGNDLLHDGFALFGGSGSG